MRRIGLVRPAFALFPALSRRARLICAILALVAAAIPILALALQPPPPPGTHRLEIVVTGRRNPASVSTEVWLLGFYRADGTTIPQTELAPYGAWKMRDGALTSHKAGDSVRWEGTLAGDARLHFIAHSWSGIVRITWDDSTQTIDLYADPATEREIVLPAAPAYATGARPAGYPLLAAGASGLLAGLLTLLAGSWLIAYGGRLFARRFFWYGLGGAGVALALIPLAITLAPWRHAATVPVRLKLAAPGRTLIDLCWDRQATECLRLIPYLDPDFQNAKLWLADLPPAQTYRLTLVFRSPVQDVALDSLTLFRVSPDNTPFYERTAAGAPGWFTAEGISVEQRGQSLFLRAAPDSKLIIAEAASLYYGTTLADIAQIWLGLAGLCLFAGGIVILLLSPQVAHLSAVPAHTPRRIWVLWLAFALAVAAQMLLIRNSPAMFGADWEIYFIKALALAERGTYDTGGYDSELNRLPGYPLLLAGVIKLFGYHLSTIALFQSILFSISVMALALSLRRWMHPLLGGLGILAAILSPVQLWNARSIMTESTFATYTTLALACLFQHLGTGGRRSTAWLALFACLATFASFIRPNGIVLYVALIAIWLPQVRTLWAQALSFPARMRAIARTTLPYALVTLLLPAALLGWSVRNYLSRSYFGPTDMTGASTVSGLMEAGIFQPQSLVSNFQPQSLIDNKKLYADYLTKQYVYTLGYNGWHLRRPLFAQLTQGGQPARNEVFRQLDDILLEITARSNTLTPWQLHAVASLRVGFWAVFLPDIKTFAGESIRYTYNQFKIADAPIIRQAIAKISPKLSYEEVGENRIFSLYEPFARHYYEYYFVLLLFSVIIFLALLRRGHVAFTALFLVFLANMVLNVVLLNVFARYIQVFDMLLIFQVLIGISLLTRRPGTDSSTRKVQSTA